MKIAFHFQGAESMTLKDAFNSRDYTYRRIGDNILYVDAGTVDYRYDFAMRVVTLHDNGAMSAIPFTQLDRDTLVEMRDRLVDLGGKPPALPSETPPKPAPQRLNP